MALKPESEEEKSVPNAFKDSQKWTGDKAYEGWFFKQDKKENSE